MPSTFPPARSPDYPRPVNLGDEDSFAGTAFSPDQHAVVSYVRVISPRIVNEFRMGFNRFRVDYTADQYEPGAALGNQFGITNSNVTPNEQNLADLFPGELLRYRTNTFAAHLPPRKYLPVPATT